MPVELQIAFNLIGTVTVVIGFVYATIQFRAFPKSRRQETALTLMRTARLRSSSRGTPDASSSCPTTLRLTRSTPSGSSSSRPSCRPASTTNLGYLVYARMIPLHLADELNGGMIRLTWRKFRGYVGQCRVGNPAAFEWFEWPYDRLTQYPLPKTDPAHVKYRDWRP